MTVASAVRQRATNHFRPASGLILLLMASSYQNPLSSIFKLLCSRRSFSRSLLAIAFVKAVNASSGVNQLLLAGEKRMACRTNFHMQIALFGRMRLKGLAAGAGHGYLVILGVNSWFHDTWNLNYSQLNAVFFKRTMIGFRAYIVKLGVNGSVSVVGQSRFFGEGK